MNILFISHMFPNNINPCYGVFVKEQALFVGKKTNVQVAAPVPFFPFASFFSKYKGTNKILPSEIIDGLKVSHPKYFFIPKIFKSLDAWFYFLSLRNFLKKLIKKEKIQILHFHWGYPDALAMINFAKKAGLKTVLTIHGNESICYFENSFRKKSVQRHLREIDHLIVVSNDLKNKVIKDYQVSSGKITVMSNAVNTNNFYEIDKNKARNMAGIDEKKQIILTVCRLSYEKGVEYLLRALGQINIKNIKLLIAGDGPLKEKLTALAVELNILDKVEFLGAIAHEKINAFYNAADIFCLPSLWEGCPCTIIESMACGLPVVSTRVGGIPDIVTKDIGILVKPGEADLLAGALVEALSKKWDYQNIRSIGQNNSLDNLADKIIDVYKKVLSE